METDEISGAMLIAPGRKQTVDWVQGKAVFLAGALAFALAASSAAAQQPPDPTASDSHANTAAGSGALLHIMPQSYHGDNYIGGLNTAIGQSALYSNLDGRENTASGAFALYSHTGSDNTASGAYALYSNTTGGGNTASGYYTLSTNSTGVYNTASGYETLTSNLTGYHNTASGYHALYSNTTGGNNTADGSTALDRNTTGTNNTASGFHALYSNTKGADNVAIGVDAAYANTTGIQNTAIGSLTLNSSSFGNNNVAIGYGAGYNLTSGSSNIYVAHQGTATESNTTRIGSDQTRAFIAGIRGVTTGATDAVAVYVDSNGQLGTINSSARFKDEIKDMGSYSARLHELRPVTYRYKEPTEDGKARPDEPGLIAEEVEKIYPDLVAYGADGQIETVQYHKLVPMLLNEFKNQATEIYELKARLDEQNMAHASEIRELQAGLAEAGAEMRRLREALAERPAQPQTASSPLQAH